MREDRPGSESSIPEEFRVFEADGGGLRVEFGRKALESIRFECSRAMNGVGGLAIGGVLLGRQAISAYRVFDWRPIPCDHSRGPAFLMSQRDLAGVASFLEGVRTEAEAQQWQIVGWFVSHPRGGMDLSGEEVELQDRFFPRNGLVMVVHPDRMGDAECAVFPATGEAGGVEFRVEPLPIKKREPGERRRPHPHTPPPASAVLEAQGPLGAEKPAGVRMIWVWAVAGTLLLSAAGGVAWLLREPEPARVAAMPLLPPMEMLSLHAGPRGGRFVVEWNGQSPAIRFAANVTLLVTDGERQTTLRLSRQDAVAGLQFFRPESGHVRVVLRLEAKNGQSFEEKTEYRAEATPADPVVPLTGGEISSAGEPEKSNGTAKTAKAATPKLEAGTETKSEPREGKAKATAKRGKRKRAARNTKNN